MEGSVPLLFFLTQLSVEVIFLRAHQLVWCGNVMNDFSFVPTTYYWDDLEFTLVTWC